MSQKIVLKTNQILPTQSFLKPGTIRYILDCIDKDKLPELPPPPLVRKIEDDFVAIDGHNLIAVMENLGNDIEVFVVDSSEDKLTGDNAAIFERNKQLEINFDTIPEKLHATRLVGIHTFKDLVLSNNELFI